MGELRVATVQLLPCPTHADIHSHPHTIVRVCAGPGAEGSLWGPESLPGDSGGTELLPRRVALRNVFGLTHRGHEGARGVPAALHPRDGRVGDRTGRGVLGSHTGLGAWGASWGSVIV